MSLEKIVVSKEQAERLRKAGWKEPTVFCLCNGVMGQGEIFAGAMWHVWEVGENELFTMSQEEGVTILPAPTIGELVEATGCTGIEYRGLDGWEVSRYGKFHCLTSNIMESLVRLFEAQHKESKP